MEEDKYVIDEKRAAAYVQSEGVRCPYCGSYNIEGGHFNSEGQCQQITCHECGSRWKDIFKRIGIMEDDDREIFPLDPEIVKLRKVLQGIYDLAEASMRDLSVDAWLIVNQISVLSNVALVSKGDHEIQN
jgi:DNA-directed RNA polymerase subunit RPC12/RpoP